MKVHFIVLTALALAVLGGCAIREEGAVMLQEGDIDRTTNRSQKSRSRLVIGRGANGAAIGVDPICMIEELGDDPSSITAADAAEARTKCSGDRTEVQRSIAGSRGVDVRSINFSVAFHPGRLYYGQSSYSGLGCGFWGVNWSINCVALLGGWSPGNYWATSLYNGSGTSTCYNRYAATNWWDSVVSWWRYGYFGDSCWQRWY